MTESTKLLFRLIRFRLGIGMGLAFLLFLFIAIFDPPLDPEYLPLLPTVSFALALLMGLHSFLGNTMFPVTDRQVAWIPMTAWGLVSLSGAAGLLTGQAYALGIDRIQIHDTLLYWLKGIPTLCVTFFVLLLIWRGLRYNIGYVGFIGSLPLVPSGDLADSLRAALEWWPLWVLGCLLLVAEAPYQTAMLRRLDYVESKGSSSPYTLRVAQLHGPMRTAWITCLADAISYFALIFILVYILRNVVFVPIKQYQNNPTSIFLILPLFLPFPYALHCWRLSRASGLGIGRSLTMLLVEMTGVGYAFRDKMGVKNGMVLPCGFCRGWRFAWQARCPHCGDEGVATIKTKVPQAGLSALLWPKHDPGAMMFRGMIPIYLLGAVLLFNWHRWFGS